MEQFVWYLGVQNKHRSIYTTLTHATSRRSPSFTKDLPLPFMICCAPHSLGSPEENYSVMCLHQYDHLPFTQFCTTNSITFDKMKKCFGKLTTACWVQTYPKPLSQMREVWFCLYGKLSYCNPEQQCSEANTVVAGTLTSPVIRHVTAGPLSVTPCTVYFPQRVGGWRRRV